MKLSIINNMPITIVRTLPPAALILLTLCGCMGLSNYDAEPPAGFSIAGTWTLNPALSTSMRKALSEVRGEHSGGRSPGSGPTATEVINDPTTDLPPLDTRPTGQQGPSGFGGSGSGQDRYRPPLDIQQDVLKGGGWLRIRQDEDEVDITNEVTARSFTPGVRSVVSVPSGVADQSSGWKGRRYVIAIRPQVGPRVLETYALSDDGRQLIVTIDIGSEGGNRSVKVRRVYDRGSGGPQILPVEN
ncbi:MAG TPA: hypothetical protein VMB48_13920 [Steroidobacteraceae bacterium]|nr:hypothetical protein [Steroidobacteraceae bacterium]